MKLIVGLGNPGTEYEKTRHNAGFMAVDFYLKDTPSISCQSKFKAQICELHFGATKAFFAKPQTFMNASGEAVKEICDYYKLNPALDLLVIHDDKDLPLGTVRTTESSSSAGHNGVQSLIDMLGTQNFRRIRIGVESRPDGHPMETRDFVLQNFSAGEQAQMESEILPRVKTEVDAFLKI